MEYTGQGKKKILVIAEAPGKLEDEKGIQLIGKSGQFFRNILEEYNIDLDRDCWKTNAVNCRPPKNRTPTNKEINACKPYLQQCIKELEPEKIIVLGKIALQALIGHKESVTSIEKWVGWKIPDQEFECWIFPTYHPAYVMRKMGEEKNIVLNEMFRHHLSISVREFFPFEKEKINIDTITNEEGAIIFLQSLKPYNNFITIDFETTGLRPFEGHKILCIGVGHGEYEQEKSTAFPIFYKNREFMRELRKVLQNPNIKKVAHNIKFENIWVKEILGYDIKPWALDTMLATHIMDNRTGITGLKFQTYVNFGVSDYNNKVEKCINADSSGFNKMDKLPVKDLLTYCAMDALFTHKLSYNQIVKKTPADLFRNGTLELGRMEMNGICINHDYYTAQQHHLDKRMNRELDKIQNSKEGKLWFEKKKKKLNPNSHVQLKELLFDILDYTSSKRTAKGNESTNNESLEEINTPFTNMILRYKKLDKIQSTYLKNFISKSYNGRLHPSFNLNTARSYRSSSSDPNFQNIPIRDEEAQRITRAGIIPSPGNQLLEVDYSGIEVCISACYHKDPAMIEYIKNPDSDMHRDMAAEIFIMDKKDISKHLRYLAKNNFVFPQFYGDYYGNCAQNIWKKIGVDIKEHLKSEDIRNYPKFEKHMKDIENRFWEDKFPIYTEWKERTWEDYQKNGYIEFLTGFRCTDVMNKKEALNRQIQGTAFHCLLYSLINIGYYLQLKKFDTKMVGQIHDSILFDLVPDELEPVKKIIRKISCEEIREDWDWIIVPLNIDAKISAIDGNWSEMEDTNI